MEKGVVEDGVVWFREELGLNEETAEELIREHYFPLEVLDAAYHGESSVTDTDGVGPATVENLANESLLNTQGEWEVEKMMPCVYRITAPGFWMRTHMVDGEVYYQTEIDNGELNGDYCIRGNPHKPRFFVYVVKRLMKYNPDGVDSTHPKNLKSNDVWTRNVGHDDHYGWERTFEDKSNVVIHMIQREDDWSVGVNDYPFAGVGDDDVLFTGTLREATKKVQELMDNDLQTPVPA